MSSRIEWMYRKTFTFNEWWRTMVWDVFVWCSHDMRLLRCFSDFDFVLVISSFSFTCFFVYVQSNFCKYPSNCYFKFDCWLLLRCVLIDPYRSKLLDFIIIFAITRTVDSNIYCIHFSLCSLPQGQFIKNDTWRLWSGNFKMLITVEMVGFISAVPGAGSWRSDPHLYLCVLQCVANALRWVCSNKLAFVFAQNSGKQKTSTVHSNNMNICTASWAFIYLELN